MYMLLRGGSTKSELKNDFNIRNLDMEVKVELDNVVKDSLENFDVHLCNVIGQLLDSNTLRVLWISTYRVRVLRELSY